MGSFPTFHKCATFFTPLTALPCLRLSVQGGVRYSFHVSCCIDRGASDWATLSGGPMKKTVGGNTFNCSFSFPTFVTRSQILGTHSASLSFAREYSLAWHFQDNIMQESGRKNEFGGCLSSRSNWSRGFVLNYVVWRQQCYSTCDRMRRFSQLLCLLRRGRLQYT